MKKILLIVLVIALIILFGTWPLSVLGKLLDLMGYVVTWLAKVLNFFNWNGLL